MMANRALFVLLTSMLAVTGCGQQPRQQQTTNPQYQNNPAQTNQVNPNIDCTPITNPNYVSGGNQAQYYYPEGCQQNGKMAIWRAIMQVIIMAITTNQILVAMWGQRQSG